MNSAIANGYMLASVCPQHTRLIPSQTARMDQLYATYCTRNSNMICASCLRHRSHSLSYLPCITVPASARIPRQPLLAVRRRGALCSRPLVRSTRVRRCVGLVDTFSLRVQLLYAYIYGCSPLRQPRSALLASLRARSASGWACARSRRGPHMHAVAPRALPRDAVTCGTMELRAAN